MRADFLDIGRFTFRQWGALQRDRYSRQVRQALQSLLDFPERGPARDEYFPAAAPSSSDSTLFSIT